MTEKLPLDEMAAAYERREGDACAAKTWSISHLIQAAIVADVLLLCWLYDTSIFIAAVLTVVYSILFAVILFRFTAVLLSLISSPEIRVSELEIAAIDKASLPVVTILVPLYREADIASSIVSAIRELNYPENRLDVKLLSEADDETTLASVCRLELPIYFEPIVLAPTYPRTKPKACNYGLAAAKGDFVVIYDAEDCDLGIRLAMRNYQTQIIDSTTWEVATSELGNWLRQRSRWVKGYFQTYLVHTKSPGRLLRTLGFR